MATNQFMIIAGEPSGDALAADLVNSLARQWPAGLRPHIFGLGGEKLKAAGVELLEDMTQHTVFGLSEALKKYFLFKRIFDRAIDAARQRLPDLIILVDFGGFNLRFAKAIRALSAQGRSPFSNWRPRIVYFVPPQVWASRPKRARTISECIDLVVGIFPFERDWYSERYPSLDLRYVGDPMASRFNSSLDDRPTRKPPPPSAPLKVALLPGSRRQEISRHLPLLVEAIKLIQKHRPCEATIVSPSKDLLSEYRHLGGKDFQWQVGGLAHLLQESDVAIASSGTVTRECAYQRIPTVVVYQVSRLTYEIGKRVITVPFIAMPNLLAGKRVYPELIQDAATPTAIAQETLQLCQPNDFQALMQDLERVVLSLGPPGATDRAAAAILEKFSIQAEPSC